MPQLNVTTVSSTGTIKSTGVMQAGTGFRLPSFTNSNRPASPNTGTVIWNTTEGTIQVWNGTSYIAVASSGVLNAWATGARPSSPSVGTLGWNTTDGKFEVYNGVDANLNTPIWVQYGQQPLGSSQDNPASSAREAAADGLPSGTAWITIGSDAYEMEFDAGDKFGTGDNGWVKYDRVFFGSNNTGIPHTEYGSPSTIIPAWNVNSDTGTNNDTISAGRHRIGRNQSHGGGNSLSTIRVQLPKLTKVQYTASYQAGGADTADFGTFTQNFSGIVNNSPYENNGSGYWGVVWSGNTGGSFGNDMLIVDPGNLGSGNNSHSANTSVLSFGSERGSTSAPPFMIWGTTDAYREYRYCNEWTLWIH